jgi:hypothetical protein
MVLILLGRLVLGRAMLGVGLGFGAVMSVPLPTAGAAGDDFAREASWAAPSTADVRERAFEWLADKTEAAPVAAAILRRAAAAWAAREDAAGFDVVDAVMEILALGDSRLAEIWQQVGGPGRGARGAGGLAIAADEPWRIPADEPWLIPADEPWLDDPGVVGFERDTVRLWLGRLLVWHDRYDDALPLLAGLDVETSIDPATLLFHRAACQHWLLEADAAIDAIDRLLERVDAIPVRYERVARLLRADLTGLEDESLDHVARRMRDVTRRLGLGRAGSATRNVQEGVIASLDRMIKELEDQQQQQSGGGGGGGGGGGSGDAATPMDESRLAGGRGPGEVRNRDLGDGDGWGNLPPHAREEALQQIGREFPPHYREAIEQYFKRLATGAEGR